MQSRSDAHKRSQRLWDCPCYVTPPQLWSTLAGELSAQGIQNWAPNVLSALVIVTVLLKFPLQGLDYQEEQAVWDAVDIKKDFSIVLDQSLSKHLTFSGFFFSLENMVLVWFFGFFLLVGFWFVVFCFLGFFFWGGGAWQVLKKILFGHSLREIPRWQNRVWMTQDVHSCCM